MYPAPFRYHRPHSLEEAVRLLAELGETARPLAGGQTLIPMMKMRMGDQSDLVDMLVSVPWSVTAPAASPMRKCGRAAPSAAR